MEHVERRHFYIRDMAEKGELRVTVRFVRTASANHRADFFTKLLGEIWPCGAPS